MKFPYTYIGGGYFKPVGAAIGGDTEYITGEQVIDKVEEFYRIAVPPDIKIFIEAITLLQTRLHASHSNMNTSYQECGWSSCREARLVVKSLNIE